jgi:hypothetical protein
MAEIRNKAKTKTEVRHKVSYLNNNYANHTIQIAETKDNIQGLMHIQANPNHMIHNNTKIKTSP